MILLNKYWNTFLFPFTQIKWNDENDFIHFLVINLVEVWIYCVVNSFLIECWLIRLSKNMYTEKKSRREIKLFLRKMFTLTLKLLLTQLIFQKWLWN